MRPNATSNYHQTKWAAEESVRHSGLDYTIFRPSLIFGPRDQFVNLFARISRFSPILPILGDGAARFQPVAVQAVAAAFTKSVTEGAAIGQTFDLCGPDTFTFEEMLDEILASTGRRRVKVHLPLGVARVQAALLEWIFTKLLHRAPPLNRDQLIMLQEDNVGRGEPANALFALPQVGFREGIARYLSQNSPGAG
jgi:NADH dehydrogenase